ncbi:MAG: replicative DNA helicase [Candidatus Kerfeldbacteria bacterium RIFCSPHIGHO2_02_FULL_42_14]|uniref:Replicative DNA helicase n=1 Tax=Candidatus Kerfeldbacteria bacterium RIFCSPHIGHO2_02_FULL_42_14 TaxID=1798540 RepID=A0A1G2ASU6_9BACT|nr:MAG: replicative DNA helicase [Candidatus Kerfeldbacteria bacterium RIFCSPHIGHO2_02_FULL_42_14]OGY80403.1 MAG: replicative DNA helicase [Candidatus Kerfeldbacteria bacterium RIFCSPHIGHO2_12_FULL_42_13]OGY83832.1 MAG: replicative DNA helicase [Candidatus Kerfeldbacteria bacterium RIFCSPLOWO2_02_FULL_42_19]OGY85323.1 MAG: replicative DNA helicase [Candidatus Kerfeldbacteria bacterium RIFCSPLOWO2_12_FULL_43_9]
MEKIPQTQLTTLGALPPQNLEAEQATLGAILIDKDALIRIAGTLQSEDFYKESHRIIFDAILDLFNHRDPIDVLSLTNRLEEKKLIDAMGGRSYLVALASSVPTASNIEHYASIVQRKATLRRLILAAHEIIKHGHAESENVDIILDRSEQLLFQVSRRHLVQNFIPIKGALTEAFERIDEIHKEGGKLRGIPTGFADLDHVLGGLQKSDLVILAARPSVGKTSLALDIARNVAVQSKIPVGIFSLEMSQDQVVDRFLCSQAGVDLWKMRTGKLSDTEDDFPRIGRAIGILSEAPLFIDDSASCNIMEIRTKARRLQMEHGLGLLVIDYLQLMEGRTVTDNRVQEISEISRSLKSLARELNIPVLALSQLSRAVELSHPPIPKLSHLRDSGSIEQDADVVMFIYREEMYKPETDRKNIAEILIAKHRNGPTGQIELYFDANHVQFRNFAKNVPAHEVSAAPAFQ